MTNNKKIKSKNPNLTRIHKALSSFGLSEKETTIYLEALQHAQSSPYSLSKATGIPRTTVYDLLGDLSLKGLVEIHNSDGLQKQQTKIKAKNPSILRELLEQKRQRVTKTEVDIVEILPFLQGNYTKHHQSSDFQYFPGIEGVKKTYFAALHQNHLPITTWENMMPMDVFGPDAMNKFTEAETQKTRDHREIIPLTPWVKHVLSYQFERNPHYIVARQMRFVDDPVFDNKLSIAMQGNRTYISCVNQDEVYGLIIKSQTLTNTMNSIFELQWQQAIPITKEIIKSWGPNQYKKAEKNR